MFLLLKQETEGITDNGVISALSYFIWENGPSRCRYPFL